jgi:D-proline reductase (dithiol) PrdB
VGLIARAVESEGIPTVVVSIARDLTAAVGTPRAIFLRWPLGHPLGEPHKPLQQRNVIFAALQQLVEAEQGGVIVDLPWRWRREEYQEPDWATIARGNGPGTRGE